MPAVIGGLLLLHLVALHASIAAMEIVAWCTFLAVVLHKISVRERPRFAVWIPAALLAAVVAISLLLNDSVRPFWFQFGFMRWTILLWAFSEAFAVVWSARFERRFTGAWATIVLITAAYAIFQFVFGIDLFRARSHVDAQGAFFRATGFFSGSLTFAYVFGISSLSVNRPAGRLFGARAQIALGVAAAAGLVASYSRGSWIGAILACLTYVVLARPKFIPYFLGATAVAMLVLSRVSEKFNDLLHLRLEHSASVRTHLWRAYAEMFRDRPWFGSGLFQTDKLLPEYYSRLAIDETFTSHAHNVPLQWLAGAGTFSFVLYAWICGYFIRAAWRLRQVSPWGWSLLLAQVFWHVGSLTEANFFDGEVNHLIVFTWALLSTLSTSAARPTPKRA